MVPSFRIADQTDKNVEIATFFGQNQLGNVHYVIKEDSRRPYDADLTKDILLLSQNVSPKTIVLITGTVDSQLNLNFYQNGYAIKRCGSGTLAAAALVIDKKSQSVVFNTPAGAVTAGRASDLFYYDSETLKHLPLTDKMPWQKLISGDIADGMLVGDRDDYCILELNDASELRKVYLDADAMCNHTKRALILTAKGDHQADYYMRYFAPQYGEKEDQATGSANAQLAEYWQRKISKKNLHGIQVSRDGGEFYIKKLSNGQRVAGRAKFIKEILV